MPSLPEQPKATSLTPSYKAFDGRTGFLPLEDSCKTIFERKDEGPFSHLDICKLPVLTDSEKIK